MGLFGKKEKTEAEKANEVISESISTIKDIIAPAGIHIDFNYIQIGETYLKTFFVYSYPRYLYTEWLSPIINANFAVDTSLYIYPVSSKEMLQKLRTKSAQIESVIAEQQQKGLVRDPLMETAYGDVEELRDTIQKDLGCPKQHSEVQFPKGR